MTLLRRTGQVARERERVSGLVRNDELQQNMSSLSNQFPCAQATITTGLMILEFVLDFRLMMGIKPVMGPGF